MNTRIAIIDLGTNALRIEVYEINRSISTLVHRERYVLRLGSGLNQTGQLNGQGKSACLEVLNTFASKQQELMIDHIIAVGTSALREAKDGPAFVEEVEGQTGISLRTISGEEEAQLIAKGIIANEKQLRGRYVLVDIGGGSAEYSLCQDQEAVHSRSLQLGAIRNQQLFLQTAPPVPSGIAALRKFAYEQLYSVEEFRDVSADFIVGSSGTARAIAELGKETDLAQLVKDMESMTYEQICAIPNMEANRADIILAGAVVLEESMKFFHTKELRISRFSLRHGLLQEVIEQIA